MLLEFDASHHAVVNLLGLGTVLVLPNRTGASVEVVKARCHYCSSKPGLLFSLFETRSLQQRQLPKKINTILGQLVTRCHRLNWS